MIQALTITIYGKPIAQARAKFRIGKNKAGKTIPLAYNPQETEAGRFALEMRSQLPAGWKPISGPVSLGIVFGMPIPKSSTKRDTAAMRSGKAEHVKKPDLDNLVKFVKDAAYGILWVDDCQVVNLVAKKTYSDPAATWIYVKEQPRR